MNESVRQAARALALSIAQSGEFIALRLAEDALDRDGETALLLDQCQALKAEGREEEAAQVLARVRATQAYRRAAQARETYRALMREVNAVLSGVLSPDAAPAPCGGCGGCAGCAGCKGSAPADT